MATFMSRGLRIATNVIRQSSQIKHLNAGKNNQTRQESLSNHLSLTCPATFHTTPVTRDLKEFFDNKENYGESVVRVGRPWKLEELRIKSNSDIHKLWYVLLKERNMLMTMEEEYKRQGELFPSPERFEKVEESMENILEVVAERDRAFNFLEKGVSGEPEQEWDQNILGIGYWRRQKEWYMPKHLNERFKNKHLKRSWQVDFLKLLREKKIGRLYNYRRVKLEKYKELQEKFPHRAAEIQEDIDELEEDYERKMKYLKRLPNEKTFPE